MPNDKKTLLEQAMGVYDNPVVNTAIGMTPVVGDIQSGVEAIRSAMKGNYGEAALNAAGLLPFVPALGGVVKGAKGAEAALTAAAKSADEWTPAYHGTNRVFTELDPKKSFGGLGVAWTTPSEQFAGRYAGKEGRILPLEIREGKNFDFNSPEHRALLAEKAKAIEIYDPIRGFMTLDKKIPTDGMYNAAEHPQLFKLIKKMGYDSVAVTEDGVRNIGVFNPKKTVRMMGPK